MDEIHLQRKPILLSMKCNLKRKLHKNHVRLEAIIQIWTAKEIQMTGRLKMYKRIVLKNKTFIGNELYGEKKTTTTSNKIYTMGQMKSQGYKLLATLMPKQ